MQKFRFSPITSENTLREAIFHVTYQCFFLCKQAFGFYYPTAKNLGIFCHYDNEYSFLTALREKITIESDNILNKYYKLITPIHIPAKDSIPESTVTHLYIRKPDNSHPQVGDLDFLLSPIQYSSLKKQIMDGKQFQGAAIFGRGDLDMIEIKDPAIDACAYIRTTDFVINK